MIAEAICYLSGFLEFYKRDFIFFGGIECTIFNVAVVKWWVMGKYQQGIVSACSYKHWLTETFKSVYTFYIGYIELLLILNIQCCLAFTNVSAVMFFCITSNYYCQCADSETLFQLLLM